MSRQNEWGSARSEHVLPGKRRAVVVRVASAFVVAVGDAGSSPASYTVMPGVHKTEDKASRVALRVQATLFRWADFGSVRGEVTA